MPDDLTIVVYFTLVVVWGIILLLYVRHRRFVQAQDRLVGMLLSVLALDAMRSFIESGYFGLVWSQKFGLLGPAWSVLEAPPIHTAVKGFNLIVASVILVRLIRRWIPAELEAKKKLEFDATQLQEKLAKSLEESRESEERFRLAAQANQHAVWDWDLRNNNFWFSNKFPEMLGYAAADFDITLENWSSRLHPDDAAATLAESARCQRGEVDQIDNRHRLKHRDGRWRWIQSSAVLIRDDHGKPARIIGLARDITADTEAEQAEIRTQKLESLGRLAGGVAHDYNNILTVILSNLALAKEDLPPDSPTQELLAAAEEGTQRAADLTRQLLAYSGRAKLFRTPVNLSETLQNLRPLLLATLPQKIQIEISAPDILPPILGDTTDLQQIVTSLVANASETMKDQAGTIRIEATPVALSVEQLGAIDPSGRLSPGTYVRLLIEDNGPGMTEAVRNRIFDPFFSTKDHGRGLGLAATAGLVRQHRGEILVESHQGRGAAFSIYFPQTENEAIETPKPNLSEALHAHVLLVDDEPGIRRSAAEILRRLGCTVTEGQTGVDALQFLKEPEAQCDLLIMDLVMPQMSGWEALPHIHQLRPNLPVILMSGYSEVEVEPREPLIFLPKPFDAVTLEQTVRRALASQKS